MKKLLMMLALASVSVAGMAQESTSEPTLKYSVATNSFWSNWFIQAGVQWAAFYPSADNVDGDSPFKSERTNPQVALAIGKWFTPGLGLRTKVSGVWGKANDESFKYWNAQEQVLFNLSNLICGYNPKRVWNLVPFAGAGIARNCDDNYYAMGLSVGLLNQFYVSRKVAINVEVGYNRLENDFYSCGYTERANVKGSFPNNGDRGWDSHDNYVYAELGLTVNLGKSTWDKVPDVDAIKALSQGQIDALNAQLTDAQNENARLKNMLANQKPAETKTVKELVCAPVSVFFNLNSSEIASRKDIINLQSLVDAAKSINGDAKFIVTGSADSRTGNDKINTNLGQRRAETVADELVNLGVSRDNIEIKNEGGIDKVSPYQYNRRAIVVVK